jgi:hypothetical protein
MSAGKERKEKICLNCNARVFGPYCHVCGQANTEPKETVWGLITHFANDITHFEGKFFTTLKYILFRPGYLTKEYERGRRASYMNPVRMYVFTSAFFFIIFFSIFRINESKIDYNYKELEKKFGTSNADFNVDFITGKVKVEGVEVGNMNQIDEISMALVDSLVKDAAKKNPERFSTTVLVDSLTKKTTKTNPERVLESDTADIDEGWAMFNMGRKYRSVAEYDSVQKQLPAGEKDNWLEQKLNLKSIDISQKYGSSKSLALARLADAFMHKLPTMFFVSLPVFAFILFFLYIRRKQYYYVNHAMFSIHYYIFTFINLLFYFAADKLEAITGWQIFSYSKTILMLTVFFYLYKAMRNYYQQRRAKTIFKFLILNFVFLIIMLFLFTGFLIFSVFNI